MLFDERLMIEAAAASVFIAAGAWGAVNAMLVALATMRYVPLRAERLGDDVTPAVVPTRSFVLHPLLMASVLMWPAVIVFVFYWSRSGMSSPVLWVTSASWPVIAVVLLVLAARSDWAKTRVWITRAAGAKKPDVRDGLLERALEEDPGFRSPPS